VNNINSVVDLLR